MQPSLNIRFTSFAKILFTDVRELAPCDDIMELDTFLHLSLLILPAEIRCDGERGDALTGRRGARIRVFRHSPNDHDFVKIHNWKLEIGIWKF